MKKANRLLSVILIAVLIVGSLTLTACGDKGMQFVLVRDVGSISDEKTQELLKLKKAKNNYDDAAIPAENAQGELKNLYNSRATPEERIRRAIRMQPAVESWSDADKAFYYYIIGDAIKRKNANDDRRLAFFAAQIYYNPVNTSLGWHELRQALPDREIHPSPDTAKQLHEEFPLPDSFESLIAE